MRSPSKTGQASPQQAQLSRAARRHNRARGPRRCKGIRVGLGVVLERERVRAGPAGSGRRERVGRALVGGRGERVRRRPARRGCSLPTQRGLAWRGPPGGLRLLPAGPVRLRAAVSILPVVAAPMIERGIGTGREQAERRRVDDIHDPDPVHVCRVPRLARRDGAAPGGTRGTLPRGARGPRLAARGFAPAAAAPPGPGTGAAAPAIRRASSWLRDVIALGLVSFFTDISSELLVYLIPLYLANVLAATPTIIGVVEGVTESVSAFLKLGSGWLSDRLGRRKTLVLTGYSTSVAAKALYLLATAWPVVLAARLGDRMGKGIRTAPRDALIADSTPPESRGRAFGLHRALDTAGALVGVTGAAIVVTLPGRGARLRGRPFRALCSWGRGRRLAASCWVSRCARASVPPSRRRGVPGGPEATSAALPTERRRGCAPRVPPGGGSGFFVARPGVRGNCPAPSLRLQSLGIAVRDILLMVIAFNFPHQRDRRVWAGRRALPTGLAGGADPAVAWSIYAVTHLRPRSRPRASPSSSCGVLSGVHYGVSDAVGKALVADVSRPRSARLGYGSSTWSPGWVLLPASILAGCSGDAVGPCPVLARGRGAPWPRSCCLASSIGDRARGADWTRVPDLTIRPTGPAARSPGGHRRGVSPSPQAPAVLAVTETPAFPPAAAFLAVPADLVRDGRHPLPASQTAFRHANRYDGPGLHRAGPAAWLGVPLTGWQLLLTTTGRKSHLRCRTPLGFTWLRGRRPG